MHGSIYCIYKMKMYMNIAGTVQSALECASLSVRAFIGSKFLCRNIDAYMCVCGGGWPPLYCTPTFLACCSCYIERNTWIICVAVVVCCHHRRSVEVVIQKFANCPKRPATSRLFFMLPHSLVHSQSELYHAISWLFLQPVVANSKWAVHLLWLNVGLMPT